MSPTVLTLSVVNFKTQWGDKPRNLNSICSYAEAAAAQGADLVVLPELTLTGYDDEPHKERPQKMHTLLAEPVPGPSSLRVAEVARRTGTILLFGLPERDPSDPTSLYNSVAVCLPDGNILCYRKLHMPFGEASWAQRGEEPLFLETPFGIIGIGICYDSYKFPEMMRFTKAQGGQLFLNVTALPFEDIRPNVNREDLEAAVLANSLYIANANLVGLDLAKHFMGGSSVLGPGYAPGQVHYYAGHPFGDEAGQHPGLFTTTIDLAAAQHHPVDAVFSADPHTGRPGWRPEVYRAMHRDILADPAWQRKVR